jgi:hypothetical protein
VQTIAQRVQLDRITAEARQIEIGRTLLTLIAVVLYAVGWLVGFVIKAAFVVVAWSFAAVKVGWNDARPRRGG